MSSEHPANEPVLSYAPGSPEREELQTELDYQMDSVIEIPCIINGEEISYVANSIIFSKNNFECFRPPAPMQWLKPTRIPNYYHAQSPYLMAQKNFLRPILSL